MKRACFFLLASLLLAQDATFIVDTKLVVINVTVKDKPAAPLAISRKKTSSCSKTAMRRPSPSSIAST